MKMGERMMKSRILLLVMAIVVSALLGPAQAGIIIGSPSSGDNAFPFGGSWSPNPSRYQQVYSGAAFTGSIDIGTIRFFRSSGGGDLASGTFVMSLSTTSQAVNGLDLVNFDNNLGLDNQLFSTQVLAGGPAPSGLAFMGDAFHYDPTQGNLLLDIQISGFSHSGLSNWSSFEARDGDAGGLFSRAHDFGSGFNDYGLVTEFEAVPVPAPSAFVLSSVGFGLIRCMRKRRTV
jgi:hypothetical protein